MVFLIERKNKLAQKLVQYSYELKKQKQKKGLAVFFYILFLFICINLIISFLVYPVKQTSISMAPDLPEDSVVMVSPLLRNFERGDIVLIDARKQTKSNTFKKIINVFEKFFTAQHYSLSEVDDKPGTKPHIRRIVGMPGDTIYMRDYVVYIKPAAEKHFLTEFEITPEPYNVTFFVPPAGWDTSLGVKGFFEEITLGENEYFVLSDNRKSSDDSRLWGKISKNRITAKVFLCYFPFSKMKLL